MVESRWMTLNAVITLTPHTQMKTLAMSLWWWRQIDGLPIVLSVRCLLDVRYTKNGCEPNTNGRFAKKNREVCACFVPHSLMWEWEQSVACAHVKISFHLLRKKRIILKKLFRAMETGVSQMCVCVWEREREKERERERAAGVRENYSHLRKLYFQNLVRKWLGFLFFICEGEIYEEFLPRRY